MEILCIVDKDGMSGRNPGELTTFWDGLQGLTRSLFSLSLAVSRTNTAFLSPSSLCSSGVNEWSLPKAPQPFFDLTSLEWRSWWSLAVFCTSFKTDVMDRNQRKKLKSVLVIYPYRPSLFSLFASSVWAFWGPWKRRERSVTGPRGRVVILLCKL